MTGEVFNKKYDKEDALKGLKIIKESNLPVTESSYNLTCIKLLDAGFRRLDLAKQIKEIDVPGESISDKSLRGDLGGALNMIRNYMESPIGAQYVRDQFEDLIYNYLRTLVS